MTTFIVPKLALREATSLAGRKRFPSDEVFDVLDKLAHRTGVVITRVNIEVRCNDSTFAIPLLPDTATEVLNILRSLSPEVHNEDQD